MVLARSVQLRANSRAYPLALATLLVVVLAGLKTLDIPQFEPDAYLYIQSAILWPQGETTFAASWVGSRHLTPLYYRLFMETFGYSLDSLAISLAALYLVSSLAIAACSFLLIRSSFLAASLSVGLAVLSFCFPVWLFPMTDPIIVATSSVLLLLWALAFARGFPPSVLLLIGLLAGLSNGVRPGALFLVIAIILVLVVYVRQARQTALRSSVWLTASFGLGALLASLSWSLWIPSEKPPGYTYAYVFYRSIDWGARGENGPASRALAASMELSNDQKLPFWEALGHTYAAYGPQESDRMLRDVGMEAIVADPIGFAQLFAIHTTVNLIHPHVIRHSSRSWDDQREAVRHYLIQRDQVQRDRSASFGDDAYVATSTLAEHRIPFFSSLRSVVPPDRFLVLLPGYLTIILLVAFVTARRIPTHGAAIVSAPCVLYVGSVLILASFSQGFQPRYMAMQHLLMAFLIALPFAEVWGGLKHSVASDENFSLSD